MAPHMDSMSGQILDGGVSITIKVGYDHAAPPKPSRATRKNVALVSSFRFESLISRRHRADTCVHTYDANVVPVEQSVGRVEDVLILPRHVRSHHNGGGMRRIFRRRVPFLRFLQRTPYPIAPPTITAMLMPPCIGLSRYRKTQVAQGDGGASV